MHASPHSAHCASSRQIGRQLPALVSSRFACTSSETPSRSSTGSISSLKPLERITGSCSSANARKPGRTVTCSRTQAIASSSGSVSVPISIAITSCSDIPRSSACSVAA